MVLKYEIGARIRQFREARGLTQVELANRLHISSGRLSNWEQGACRPNADILAKLCRALEVSPSELLDLPTPEQNLTEHERQVITAYREKPNLQNAIDILLGIDK